MDRYWITLPLGMVIIFALILLVNPYRKIRRKALVVFAIAYALGNTYLIAQDSFYGLLDFYRQDTSSTEFKITFGLPILLFVIAVCLALFTFGIGYLFMNLSLNIRVYKKYKNGRENSLSFLDFCYKKAEKRQRKEGIENGQSV